MFRYCTVCIFFIWVSTSNAEISIEVWKSEPNNQIFLTKYPNINFKNQSTSSPPFPSSFTININHNLTYQQMDGFGGSLTDASSWLLKNRLSEAKRAEVLKKVFGAEGINLSLLRQPIGTTDFSLSSWSLDEIDVNSIDNSKADGLDLDLKNFTLCREEAYIRPILDQALAVNRGRVKLFATPWSPPAWMKSRKIFFGNAGGHLRPDCYDSYANYFIKYLKEYARRGTPIYGITVQNEPLYGPADYPGMRMYPNEQMAFIRDSLGPEMRKNGLSTKILAYDHNYDEAGVDYVYTVLDDPEANKYIDGVGFHTYAAPNHEAMTDVHNKYAKDVWITEAGSGTWIGNDTAQFQDQMMHLVRSPRNWAKGVIFWNIALDQNSNPKLINVDPDGTNRAFVTIRSDQLDSVKYEMSYYTIGHSSKFVDPGAFRIDSSSFRDDIETVAYLNPDSTIVVVISNRSNNRSEVKIVWKSYEATFSMEPISAASLKWNIL